MVLGAIFWASFCCPLSNVKTRLSGLRKESNFISGDFVKECLFPYNFVKERDGGRERNFKTKKWPFWKWPWREREHLPFTHVNQHLREIWQNRFSVPSFLLLLLLLLLRKRRCWNWQMKKWREKKSIYRSSEEDTSSSATIPRISKLASSLACSSPRPWKLPSSIRLMPPPPPPPPSFSHISTDGGKGGQLCQPGSLRNATAILGNNPSFFFHPDNLQMEGSACQINQVGEERREGRNNVAFPYPRTVTVDLLERGKKSQLWLLWWSNWFEQVEELFQVTFAKFM